MTKIARTEALGFLYFFYLVQLTREQRENILFDMVEDFDSEDPYDIRFNDEIKKYFFLLQEGVTNDYISKKVAEKRILLLLWKAMWKLSKNAPVVVIKR